MGREAAVRDDMEISYRHATSADAAQLLDYLKRVGAETDYLTFGAQGLPVSLEQEQAFLAQMENSPHSRLFLALDGETVVGNASVNGNSHPRFGHRRNLGITVLRDYWGRGIGSTLMTQMIAFAKETGAELLSLEVRSDNERAKALYRKFGFVSCGTYPKYLKIDGQYFDVDCMTREL